MNLKKDFGMERDDVGKMTLAQKGWARRGKDHLCVARMDSDGYWGCLSFANDGIARALRKHWN